MLKGVNPGFIHFSKHRSGNVTPPPRFFRGSGDVILESDEFRMYAFKIKRCPRTRSHDWTDCPYAHRGEKARRRDPRKFNYSAIACPEFRTGECRKGELCEFAHGIFEFWLHPARYRTRICNAGKYCRRKVCFFAHTPQQLRSETKYKCHYIYRARMDGSCGEKRIIGELDENHMAGSPPGCTRNEVSSEESWDFLESLRGLKIREEVDDDDDDEGKRSCGRDVADFPDIDWISDLVK